MKNNLNKLIVITVPNLMLVSSLNFELIAMNNGVNNNYMYTSDSEDESYEPDLSEDENSESGSSEDGYSDVDEMMLLIEEEKQAREENEFNIKEKNNKFTIGIVNKLRKDNSEISVDNMIEHLANIHVSVRSEIRENDKDLIGKRKCPYDDSDDDDGDFKIDEDLIKNQFKKLLLENPSQTKTRKDIYFEKMSEYVNDKISYEEMEKFILDQINSGSLNLKCDDEDGGYNLIEMFLKKVYYDLNDENDFGDINGFGDENDFNNINDFGDENDFDMHFD